MVRIDLNDVRKELVKDEHEQHKQEYKHYNRGYLRGDIYYVDLGEAKVQGEQSGIRPCIIIQNNVGNKFSPTVIVSVLSSQIQKCKLPTHVLITREECKGLRYDSFVATEQIKTISKDKLGDYIGHVENERLDKAIRISLALEKTFSKTEEVLLDKVKHLKELDMMISMMLDKTNNVMKDYIEQFVNDRHNLLLDIKLYCNKNNMDLEYYYKNEEYIKIAI